MDEGTLNDLLECSVCLERLDTSSKVLPCQHTFCKKCLEEIVEKHKELRCPECRILITVRIEDLPPNVLLMRILEGMKNSNNSAGLKKVHRSNKGSPQQNAVSPAIQNALVAHSIEQRVNNKHSNIHAITHQPYAKAMYDYAARETGDLSFKRGDIIILKKRMDSHWYHGEAGGKQGVFPLSYVQIITPLPSHIPQCKALYDFRMTNDEEEGCLAFNKGDIINVIRRVDENWAEGKLEGKIGIFPLAFVELNNLARSLMKLSSNAQPGPSKVAPPTPTTEDSTPLIPTDHTRTCVQQPPAQNATQAPHVLPPVTSDSSSTVSSGSSSTTTPNVSSSNTSSSSSTGPSSPASPPPRSQPLPPRVTAQKPDILLTSVQCSTPQRSPQPVPRNSQSRSSHHHHNKEKRHSFTGTTVPHLTTAGHRHSAEITAKDGHIHATERDRSRRNGHSSHQASTSSTEPILPAAYIALYPYKPQKSDELELRKGGIYMVTEICQDGWYKGTSNRTQKCGVFPGNYVTIARGAPNSTTSRDGAESKLPVSFTRAGKSSTSSRAAAAAALASSNNPPELPPRAASPSAAVPATNISSSWHGHGHQDAAPPLGRSSSAVMPTAVAGQQQHASPAANKSAEKSKERKEKGTVSLMRRLASMKRSKSPPPSSYSMDNPVFEDVGGSSATSTPTHPVHVRSGSCPSQLLQIQPSNADHHRMFGSASQRIKYKERPSVLVHNTRPTESVATSASSSPDVHRHRKSNSLDAGNRTKTGVQTVRERFRCLAPYPPNSEFELELQVGDIIYVHKKRDDGWYKGTQQRTGKTGLFPASFVEGF